MSTYRKLSTLLTIACLMYMFFVSLLQLRLQNERYQGQQYIGSKKANGNQHNSLHKGSSREQTEDSTTDTEQTVRETELGASDQPRHIDGESSSNSQSFILRKLSEKKGHQQTASSEYDTQFTDDETVDSFPVFKGFNVDNVVPQTNVTFLPVADDFYVFGAYLDSRFPPDTYARIFALRQILNQTARPVCQFKDFDNRGINILAQAYEMCENHGKKFGGWIYSCLIPTTIDFEPQNISFLVTTETGSQKARVFTVPLHRLTEDSGSIFQTNGTQISRFSNKEELHFKTKDTVRDDTNGNTNVVIENTQSVTAKDNVTALSRSSKFKIGVCVPPLFGNIYLPKLINFIEMCRLLKAEQIFLYTHDISEEIIMFLRRYNTGNSNILSLINWDLPVISKSSPFSLPTSSSLNNQIIWNRGQLLAVQHCLYSNMAEYDWLLFIDTDEMLVPKSANTWRELITETIDQFPSQFQRNSIAGISFESAFFQQDFQTQVTNSIDYFQYLHRTKDTSSYRSKLFVRPSQVFELGIHHLSKPISRQLQVIKATPSLGLLHHYRKCVVDENGDEMRCEILVKDDTILKYEAPLTIASRKVVTCAMRFFANQR